MFFHNDDLEITHTHREKVLGCTPSLFARNDEYLGFADFRASHGAG